ncbi:hypothetical protein QJV03_09060 [Listeria swaminathanii]|uniref:Lipoprotein n=1 Tax=Listeria swaminathanii TaxID=2713501 RepID=A0ABU2IH69_9LIST|nr:hypothetical protein [Listeria swaminathanii]MDT0017330.1 hypothetical protein [Listeria swaminathanii]MDT0023284.1 hypothetical protein [Listeria swaminathanii]MDT0034226.1 hypothetical protein [Listeria swaminathanii]MDT0053049.1 hypothetical protein [Listeria swaminathanii]MDT0055814.1 hypothetical protein [Listeria swaminathanii]
MKSRNWLKGIGITIVTATVFLTGCGNGDAEKIDTEEQTKNVEDEGEKVEIESNEGKPHHEQLIKIALPPEAEYLNDETLEVYEQDKKKYDNTNQRITNNSITILIGEYGYYDPVQDALECSAVIINGTDSIIEDLSFQVSIENNAIPEKVFLDNTVPELTKSQVGNFLPNMGVPVILGFPEKNPTNGNENGKKIDTNKLKIHLSNIQYKKE